MRCRAFYGAFSLRVSLFFALAAASDKRNNANAGIPIKVTANGRMDRVHDQHGGSVRQFHDPNGQALLHAGKCSHMCNNIGLLYHTINH